MKGKSLLALVAGFLLASCADSATAPLAEEESQPSLAIVGRPFRPGEQQPLVDLTRGFTYAIYPPGEGQILAQTFRPRSSGTSRAASSRRQRTASIRWTTSA